MGDDECLTEEEPFVISFEDLTVHVPESRVNTLLAPLQWFGKQYLCMSFDIWSSFYAIQNISAYVKSGEACLILGPSGSGKSTLLRALSCRLSANDNLQGGIYYNGMILDPKYQHNWRRMTSYVSSRDDEHNPFLTVFETLEFAAQCTSDGNSSVQDITSRVNNMLEVLGLTKVVDTIVGNNDIRGISGGQRRRLTVGEMLMNPKTKFLCLDNITNGLASTDAMDLIKFITNLCKTKNISAMVTLQQPSDEIVHLFNKLLVFQDGKMNYYGPMDHLVLNYIFSNEDDVNDGKHYSIVDLVLHQSTQNMRSSTNNTSESVNNNLFLLSSYHTNLLEELKSFHQLTEESNNNNKSLIEILPNEKYSTSYKYQMKIIYKRKMKLVYRNPVTCFRPLIAFLFGIIVGTYFSELRDNIMSNHVRNGLLNIFIVLAVVLSATSTIPTFLRDRNVLYKHRSSEFYSGKISYAIDVVLDGVQSFWDLIVMSVFPYLVVDMKPGISTFLFFYVVLLGVELYGQACGRILCGFVQGQVSARNWFSFFCFTTLTIICCFPVYPDLPELYQWLTWINPFTYAFEALVINNLEDTSVTIFEYTDEETGTVVTKEMSGEDYMESVMSIPRIGWASITVIKWFNLGFILAMSIIVNAIAIYSTDYCRRWFYNHVYRSEPSVQHTDTSNLNTTQHFYTQVNNRELNPNETSSSASDMNDVEHAITQPLIEDESDDNNWPKTLSVVDLTYTVFLNSPRNCFKLDDTKEGLNLIQNVTAQFHRGKMTALMGASGAGKTTLLDVIAGYKRSGVIAGSTYIDGRIKKDSTWKRITGYAEQNDILNPFLSVFETLQFTANCRLPHTVDKKEVIYSLINLLGLQAYTDNIVGRENLDEGLPKHARKRLTIANELVTQPKILFLDEPTTNLESDAASLIIEVVRQATDVLGLICIVTIHQPSRYIFEKFDDLLLLANEGKVAYMGPIGEKSDFVMKYFAAFSDDDVSSSGNTADYILQVLENDEHTIVTSFQSSSQYSDLQEDIKSVQYDNNESLPRASTNSIINEFLLLLRKHFLCDWRNYGYLSLRFIVSSLMCLWASYMIDISPDYYGILDVLTIYSFLFVIFGAMALPTIMAIVEDRAVMYRETCSGTYSNFMYGISKLIVDIVLNAVNACLMFACYYYQCGLRDDTPSVLYALFMTFLGTWVMVSIAQLCAFSCPNEETATALCSVIFILFTEFSGMAISYEEQPDYWIWAYMIDIAHYISQGFVTNEFVGQSYFLFEYQIAGPVTKDFYISGERVLNYYGWADEDSDGNYIAPYKWDYCVVYVVYTIIAVEILKLFAICFITWTKR